MDFNSPIISFLLHFLLIVSLICPINSSETRSNHQLVNQTFRSEKSFHKLKIQKMITTRLQQLNKPAVKTIQSPDGDIIDCVLTHKQPAFDHPLLKGQKPLNPPKRSRRNNQIGNSSGLFQVWRLSGESCPKGTIPIRRVTEQDLLRADSIARFGRKNLDGKTREYAYGSVDGDGYTGARANLNVWRPKMESKDEYSLAKISLSSKTSGETIEVGWQVFESLYRDRTPRLFIYWTADKDNNTGCYNLLCQGFIQTNTRVVIGGTIHPWSSINRNQYDLPDPNFSANKPQCYDVRGAYNKEWGYYLYYGGPGHNDECPL